jgi:hypothetical protein
MGARNPKKLFSGDERTSTCNYITQRECGVKKKALWEDEPLYQVTVE